VNTDSVAISERSTTHAGWVLLLLTAAMGINQLDRGVVAILLQSIKSEMHLSDTALGLLTGFGFSIVYATASIPIGRLADRYSRINIISFGMLFYSAMAACMGFAANITQLIAARSAVAVGEATGSAPSTSLIADLYTPRSRARAMGVWSSGTFIGLFFGLIGGGWLNQHYGWRVALWAIATPGVLVALALKLTASEPVRGQSDDVKTTAEPKSTAVALHQLLANSAYLFLLFAIMCSAFVNYTFSAWVPSFLARIYHLDATSIGLAAGFFKGLLGLGGALLGGFAAHYFARGRLRAMGILAASSSLLIVPSMLVFLFAPSQTVSLIGLGVGSLLIPACQAPGLTVVQAIVASGNRSFATTLIFTCSSLFGLGLGPLATGMISDAAAARHGAQSLAYGLLLPTIVSLGAAGCFLAAANRLSPQTRRG
jgi:MFS family permease